MIQQQVKRYNAIATYSGTAWEGIVQFNTLGTVVIAGADDITFTSDGLFTENKTSVKMNIVLTTSQAYQITTMTEDVITIGNSFTAPLTGNQILIEIEVFDLDELNQP